MNFDLNLHGDVTKRQVLREFIDHVSASKERQDEKSHRSGRTTDLNLYVIDNSGYKIGDLDAVMNDITEEPKANGHAKRFVREHTFSEAIITDDIAILSVTTPDKERTDNCVLMTEGEYAWVLTTERQEWRKNIENLIKYIPDFDRLYLSSEYLEALTSDETIDDSFISGFTAEYHAPYAERQATLRFHGGRQEDLDIARREFNATPTRIEFDQTNSPASAIEGATTNTGRISLQSVRQGSQEKAISTITDLTSNYQEIDDMTFGVKQSSNQTSDDNGFSLSGFTAIELKDPDRDIFHLDNVDVDSLEANEDIHTFNKDEEVPLISELKRNVLNSNQYMFADRDRHTLRVVDKDHEEIFDIAVEPPDIIIYPRESATAHSMRDIVQNIYDYDSTYSHNKVEDRVGVS